MAILIIGPTCSGKSTLIEKSYQNSNSNNKKKVLFGYELEKNTIDENSIVHYNLLRFLTQDNNNQENLTFENDIAFKIILKNLKKFSQIIVLVTPIEELISRINKRDFNEKHLTSEKYDKTFWLEIIQKTNLFKIYENLFELFEINSLNYEILFSSSKIPDQFVISDRVFVHHNLRGIYISSPSLNEVSKISKSDKFQYQSVTLPYGEKTSVGRFDHITLNRYQSYSPFISMDLKDKSVLDIGCAMGNVLFTAERYGARDLIGIEMNDSRYEAATILKNLLHSQTEIIKSNFESYNFEKKFDYVLALNVIHHVSNFELFIKKAADLTRDTLFLEFPTFKDPKFSKLYDFDNNEAKKLNALPIIGVSSLKKIDQTYIYSPKSILKLFSDRIDGFNDANFYPSPLEGRVILSFTRKGSKLNQSKSTLKLNQSSL